jgi:hypothetical protein
MIYTRHSRTYHMKLNNDPRKVKGLDAITVAVELSQQDIKKFNHSQRSRMMNTYVYSIFNMIPNSAFSEDHQDVIP